MKFLKLVVIICIFCVINTRNNSKGPSKNPPKSPSKEVKLGAKCIFSKLKNSCESKSQSNLVCDDLMGKCRLSNGQKCTYNQDPYAISECLSTSNCVAPKGKVEGICTDRLKEKVNKVFGISSTQ